MIANGTMLLGSILTKDLAQSGATFQGATTTGAGTAVLFGPGTAFRIPVGGCTSATFQWTLKCTSGNCSATCLIQVSNDGVNWITFATTTFAAAASPQTDGTTLAAPWLWVRANVTALTGTGAQVYCVMGVV